MKYDLNKYSGNGGSDDGSGIRDNKVGSRVKFAYRFEILEVVV